MLRTHVANLISAAVHSLIEAGDLPRIDVPVEITDTKSADHGDYACNFALIASKSAGMNPRAIGEKLQQALAPQPDFEKMEVAGPGFLNLKLKPEFIAGYVDKILALGEAELSKSTTANPKRLNVEFVSVNPNGPITVGSGRGAAFGDTLCRVFEAVGHEVDREYYINDGVNSEQMRLFAESVKHYFLQALGHKSTMPEKGYQGDYVRDVAHELKELHAAVTPEAGLDDFREHSQNLMLKRQRDDLSIFGVNFKRWFSEQSLHDEGKVEVALNKLRANHTADDEPYSVEFVTEGKERVTQRKEHEKGPLWLRSTKYGDDKDRVLLRSDGRPAYIAADVAYMENKLGERGYDKSIVILGPDHHGYIGRMNAVCQALGYPPDRFEIIIFQIVRFVKNGQPAPMRKRDGNIYELRDLIEELGANVAPRALKEEQRRTGADVTRFFYLMRSHETHMDFDIDLATKQSDENPVFYVQYAHARICSVLKKAAEAGINLEALREPNSYAKALSDPRELALIKKILDLPFETARCAEDYGVHRLTTFAVELARTYHHFYDGCRVIQPEQVDLSRARVQLCEATRIGLKATLNLLGVSAPERMDRAAAEI